MRGASLFVRPEVATIRAGYAHKRGKNICARLYLERGAYNTARVLFSLYSSRILSRAERYIVAFNATM